MTPPRAVLGVALALAMGAGAAAPGVVIWRCVARDGAITIQNDARCPKGTQAQKRVMERPAPPAPAPIATPAPAAPVPATAASPAPAPPAVAASPAEAAPADAPKPAPPIYACLTPDAQRYYADAETSSRCAPLAVVGLAGGDAGTVAQACQVVEDRCEAVAEDARCAAWTERRQQAEQARMFRPEAFDAANAELERVQAATAGTVCGR